MILIIDLSDRPLSRYEFVKPIEGLAKRLGKEYMVRHYSELGEVNGFSHIILCGTAIKDSMHLEHLEMFSWLKTIDTPVLGICAGFQTIGAVFGEKIIKIKEIGMKKIHLEKKNILFDKDIDAFTLHHLAIEPDNTEILARSDACVHAIKTGNIYGVLFHPEVRNRSIIENFLSN